MSQTNNAERLYDWAQQVMQVEFVKLINKRFGGVVPHEEGDGKVVTACIDSIISDITKVENVSKLGLGVPFFTIKGEQK